MIKSFIPIAEALVNEISYKINNYEFGLKEAEEQIRSFVNSIGQNLLEKVVDSITEPTQENRFIIDGDIAIYRDTQNLRLKTIFGKELIRPRRVYKLKDKKGGYYPLDEKLGTHMCKGFSPAVTSLICILGCTLPYNQSSRILSEALGFPISSTGVETNSEHIGNSIDHRPMNSIPEEKQHDVCDLMLVSMDGTMSPRIKEVPGIIGRESMKQPTEYKECNVVVIQKFEEDKHTKDKTYTLKDKWTGAAYGPRNNFEQYIHQAGIKMGQLKAKKVVFIADGLNSNWDIKVTCFPDAIEILDFYHASEHLAQFCNLIESPNRAKQKYAIWRTMLLEGEVLQVITELKDEMESISDKDEGQKHINYFTNNEKRMEYDFYRKQGFPIGSGVVEGACKFVVGKRFKGSGMRWKKKDNENVLALRIAYLNNYLSRYFQSKYPCIELYIPKVA